MSILGNEQRYGLVAQALHWITAILVVWAWLIAGTWARGGDESPIMGLHQTLGFTIFGLVVLRLVWRLFDTRPADPPMPRVLAILGRVSHWLLYGLLIAVPLSAIVGTQLEGDALRVYGTELGPFLPSSRQIGHDMLENHQLFADALIWLAGLHAAAAIFHHFVLRDRVLKQMLPVS